MSNSQLSQASSKRINPRKMPSQSRSTLTVDAILEGAAHILERYGLEGYTTNAIAQRSGVSIGSLYQYFPTKDAITVALLERESGKIAQEVASALQIKNFESALREMITIAVRQQLKRPELARLLDFEQTRLSTILPISADALAVRQTLVDFLKRHVNSEKCSPEIAAADMMSIVSALTDSAGRSKEANSVALAQRIEGAVLGYLNSTTKCAKQ
jgi:AcrR family transcriptional regulator